MKNNHLQIKIEREIRKLEAIARETKRRNQMIIKLARRMAEMELNREEGASVEADGIYYEVKGATLEDVEMKFKNFKIYHKGSYWQVADEEIKEEGNRKQ